MKDASCLVQVLVVDSESIDRIRQIARGKGAELIIEPKKGS